jgi:5'-3' exonuclease
MVTMVVDGNYLLHRCCHTDLQNLTSDSGKPTGGIYGFLRSLRELIVSYRPNSVIVTFDGGISVRRRTEYPPYKGSKYRDKADPYYEEPDNESKQYIENFTMQRKLLQFLLEVMAIRVIRIKGVEADDVINFLSCMLNGVVNIVSDDKDFLQLVRQRKDSTVVNVIRPIAGQFITYKNFIEIIGTNQHWHEVIRAIDGDFQSDKIPGVPGVGGVTISKIFSNITPDYVDLYPFDRFFEYCALSSDKRILKVFNDSEIVLRNYRLMHLDFEVIGTNGLDIKHVLEEPIVIDMINVVALLTKLSMRSILSDINQWIVPFQRLT